MVLECSNLVKEYNDGNSSIKVLDGVNLNIVKGESVAIVGPSGSGKSTLLHILGGLDLPTSGYVKVMGENLSTLREKRRCKIRNKFFGFVYQHHHLLKDFTVIENIIMPLLIAGDAFKTSRIKAHQLLKLVSLEDKGKYRVSQLSGGEKQRVAILRAIINNPKCVLADEPTGNLDHTTAMNVFKTLTKLKDTLETSFIIVTHDTNLAEQMDHVYYLSDGNCNLQK